MLCTKTTTLARVALIIFIGLNSRGFSQVQTIAAESELIAILAADSSSADKAMACKRLAVYGTSTAVPELAKLLADEQLASWTRIALEAIPGTGADEALRDACDSLSGNLLIGVVNSIGVRRDRAATEVLSFHLKSSEPEVAAAAANALGKLGGEAATEVLRNFLAEAPATVRSAVAEGCVLCAEQFLAEGNVRLAADIYDQVRQAELPIQRIVEATRGAILARNLAGIPLLIETLGSSNKALFHVALQTAREIPSRELAAALVAEIDKSGDGKAPLIVQALADMPGSVDQQTIIQLAAGPSSKEVRVAAIGALGRIGDAACVAPLLKIALQAEDLVATVKAALVEIPDEAVNQEIVDRLAEGEGELDTQLLIEVVGLRRIQATSELINALASSSSNVRTAALESLGSTVEQDQLSLLISQVVSPVYPHDLPVARQALQAAAIRMPDREACAAELTEAMANASVATQLSLLEVLGAVGGTNALQTLAAYGKDANPQLKDVSSRLLGEWMTIDAAPVLLELATTGPTDKFQVRAMRGYIRIARQFVMSEPERVAMCATALQAARQLAEQKLVVEVLERYPSTGTLKLAIEASQLAGLKENANHAAISMAEKMKDNQEAQAILRQAGLTKP